MKRLPPSLSESPEKDFRFVGGNSSVDFVNTVVWTSEGLVNERLVDYASLVRWAEESELITRAAGRRLGRLAKARPGQRASAYEKARRLRWILWNVFTGVAGERVSENALAEFNLFVREAMNNRSLHGMSANSQSPVAWQWDISDGSLDWLLWPVVTAAADLLVSEDARRIRMCAGATCGWVYVDRSRNGLRRWCEMETCGTAEKSRRRAERQRAR